jgi:antitoxin HicB
MDTLAYPANLEADPSGGFVVTFPDFGYGVTEGDTREEALGHASDLLKTLIASAIADNEDLPVPSPADGRPLVCTRGREGRSVPGAPGERRL